MSNVSAYFSGFWGAFLVVSIIALTFVPSPKKLILSPMNDKNLRSSIVLFLIVLGVFSIYYHNVWDDFTTSLITLFGWGSLVKGITLLAFPSTLSIPAKFVASKYFKMYSLLVLVLGFYLLLWSIGVPINV